MQRRYAYLNTKRHRRQIVVTLRQFYAECDRTFSFYLLKSELQNRGSLVGVVFCGCSSSFTANILSKHANTISVEG